MQLMSLIAGFSWEVDYWGIFNNRLLFSLLFSGNFVEGAKALMERDKVLIGEPPSPPTRENPRLCPIT